MGMARYAATFHPTTEFFLRGWVLRTFSLSSCQV